MIPAKLVLANFTSYGISVPTLDFSKFQIAAISGQNGAGKSSLLDAITWCLWGYSRLGDNSDQLVRLGQNQMTVEFSFELDGHRFTVKRKRSLKSGGNTSLEFFSGLISSPQTHNLTEGTIKTTQQKIIQTLHLTYETFINSAFLRQGHADEFTTKGPAERKKILADILGLSHYDLLEEKTKEKVKALQNELKLKEYQLLEIEAELSQKEERDAKKKQAEEKAAGLEAQINTLEERLKALREQKEILRVASEQGNKLRESYQQNKVELEKILGQGKKRKEAINSLEEELSKLKEVEEQLVSLKDLRVVKEKMEAEKQKRLEIEKKLSEIQGKINLKKQQQEQLKKEIIQLKDKLTQAAKAGAKCPTCGQEMGKENKQHACQTLSQELDKKEKELWQIHFEEEGKEEANLLHQLEKLQFDLNLYLEITRQLSGLEKLQRQKDELLEKKAVLETEKKVVLEMRQLFQDKKSQVDKLEAEVKGLLDLDSKVAVLNEELAAAEKQINIVRQEEKQARSLLGQMNELISRTAQMEKLQKETVEKKAVLEKDKEAFEELSLAFGKKGIQAMIIETALPEIEDEANRLLDKLTDARMKVSLQTQKETKTKIGGEHGIIETLDIIISDEMGERPYESFSGGEAFRVNFALRLALSKLLTHRAGSKLQFLVIDEGFGTQDAQGRSRIVEALNAIKNDFAKIVVITHLEELKEEFPVRIEVSKGPAGSTFEVVGV